MLWCLVWISDAFHLLSPTAREAGKPTITLGSPESELEANFQNLVHLGRRQPSPFELVADIIIDLETGFAL
jgi:hypothetical protein